MDLVPFFLCPVASYCIVNFDLTSPTHRAEGKLKDKYYYDRRKSIINDKLRKRFEWDRERDIGVSWIVIKEETRKIMEIE